MMRNDQTYPSNALCDLYGVAHDGEGLKTAKHEAAADRGSSVFDTLLYRSRNLESYRPNRYWWLLVPLAFWWAAIGLLDAVGVLTADGLMPSFLGISLITLLAIFLAIATLSLFYSLSGLCPLSPTEREALASELTKYPYRRQIVVGWLRGCPNITKFDRDAALRLPTVHAKEAKALLRQFDESERQAEAARATEQLKGGSA